MFFALRENKKGYCASCKKEIESGSLVAFSTTKTGLLKIHHQDCEKPDPFKEAAEKPVKHKFYVTPGKLFFLLVITIIIALFIVRSVL